MSLFSIITFAMVMKNKQDCFDKININFTKNFRKVIKVALIFFMLNFIVSLICGAVSGKLSVKNLEEILVLFITPFNLIFVWIMFFGEEFAWRGYLQSRLQAMFGKKLGVVILGIIWGMWHLPLCLMLYSPTTPILGIISQCIFCILIGIFLGYAYMKTGNLWAVIIIHIINNSSLSDSAPYGRVLTLEDVIISMLLFVVIYLPFIFTKEYKAHSNK